MPLYVREGSIVPLHLDSDALALGDKSFANATTVLAFPGRDTAFTLHRDDGSTGLMELRGTTLTLAGVEGRVIVRMRTDDAATMRAFADLRPLVEVSELSALATGAPAFFRDERALWLAADAPREVSIAPSF